MENSNILNIGDSLICLCNTDVMDEPYNSDILFTLEKGQILVIKWVSKSPNLFLFKVNTFDHIFCMTNDVKIYSHLGWSLNCVKNPFPIIKLKEYRNKILSVYL